MLPTALHVYDSSTINTQTINTNCVLSHCHELFKQTSSNVYFLNKIINNFKNVEITSKYKLQ